jgi:hypothetical protein
MRGASGVQILGNLGVQNVQWGEEVEGYGITKLKQVFGVMSCQSLHVAVLTRARAVIECLCSHDGCIVMKQYAHMCKCEYVCHRHAPVPSSKHVQRPAKK